MVLPLLLAVALAAPPPVPREFRGVWVATVDNIDWPSEPGLPVERQKAELVERFDVAASMGLNAVVFQVRPMADAMYPSALEPWSEFLTGEQGRPPSPSWDPLDTAIKLAHERGMELHAWINPYRAWHSAAKGPKHATHVVRTEPKAVVTYGSQMWLNPAHPSAVRRTEAVIRDLVRRYDLDGIHIDDYFYPYPAVKSGKPVPFDDDAEFNAYRRGGGKALRDEWRRSQVNRFVERFYRLVKKEKSWVRVGISPFGIYRPGVPKGIEAGLDQYAQLYADAKLWWNRGWCDYLAPQLYWPIDQKPQAFPVLLDWWASQNTARRSLWPGLYASRVLEGKGWDSSEVLNQVELARSSGKSDGAVLYSLKPLLRDARSLRSRLSRGAYAQPAAPPSMPWLGSKPPPAPRLARRGDTVAVDAPGARWWAVFEGKDGVWLYRGRRFALPEGRIVTKGWDSVAVRALDAFGIESTPTVLVLR